MVPPGMSERAPLLRWPSLVHPTPAAFLGFPLPPPPPPTGATGALGSTEVADEAALASVITALQAVDVGYL